LIIIFFSINIIPNIAHRTLQVWGVPVHDDRVLFEFLTLEGAQAGLSWSTILKKKEGYREAFVDWDIDKVAAFDDAKVEELVLNPNIVRHRGKIQSTISNARLVLETQQEFGRWSIDELIG
jgi:DNA-3-methyladenine glycosylase I